MAAEGKKESWQSRFVEVFALMHNWTMAAEAAGVSRTHAHATYASDAKFRERVDEAKDMAVDRLERRVWEHARQSASTQKWLLERLRPETYNLTRKQEISGPNGQPIQIDFGRVLDERLASIVGRLGEPESEIEEDT